jgi:hypothetical protein
MLVASFRHLAAVAIAVAAKPAPVPATAATPCLLDRPLGQGVGGQGAISPSPHLTASADVVLWSVLLDVKAQNDKTPILPVFSLGQLALNQETQHVQGFTMPLDPGEKQPRLWPLSVRLTCLFCLSGGPERRVEGRTKTPLRYSLEPVTAGRRRLVLNDESFGLSRRMMHATSVK